MKIRPTIGQQMKLATNGLAIWFSASSHRMSGSTLPISTCRVSGQSLPSLIVRDGGRVLLVDTAWTDDQTQILNWIKQEIQPAGRAGGGDSRASGQDGRYGRAACGGDCDLCQCVVEPACPARGLVAAQLYSLTFAANGWVRPATAPNFGPLKVFLPRPRSPPVTISPLGSTAPTSLLVAA